MKVYTVADIEALNPCADHAPLKYVDATWTGTVVDILNCTQVNHTERLWVVLRPELLDDKTLRLFAAACARRALATVKNPDPRSIEACDVAERFSNGEATMDELASARNAARNAAANVAWYAADAARDAANAAAYAATATASAANAAWYAAADAARNAADAVVNAERQYQIDWLINYLRG